MKILRSLWFKLIGGYAVVITVMIVVVTFTVNRAVKAQFDRYLVGSGQIWTEMIAPIMAEVYVYEGDWDNAQDILEYPLLMPPIAQAETMGPGMMESHRSQQTMLFDSDFWSRMGWRLVLVDADGVVRGDTGDTLIGERITPESLVSGTPITVDGRQVGTLLFVTAVDNAPLRASFLAAVDKAVLAAGLSAGGVALLMGTLLFLGMTRPLHKLRTTAERIAQGDLSVRADVRARNELGTVAEAFNHMAAGLDRQQRLRQQMVADIAHELRTPISVIQGTLEAMLDGVLQADPAELRDLHGETRRLARLVEDLRTLSLADAGQLNLLRQHIDPANLTESVVNRMLPLAEAREITLTASVERPLPMIDADADRIAQVLTNLIDNALRYTPSDGKVTVRAWPANAHVNIAVSDTGPGIPPEDLPNLFERFWRGDRSRNRHGGGTGLGLAIARELVELHAGTIDIDSQPGKGSTFTISLPAA